jgi:mono/diheme cytochrome c family protein
VKTSELVTRLVIGLALVGAVAAPLVAWTRVPLLHARTPESGGWNPGTLRAQVGVPLHLRLTSDDVMHGFAIGQSKMEPVDVQPGLVSDVTLTFDQPGTYTYYCTRWCGINHWRMRGTIEVTVDGPLPIQAADSPLYVSLGLDIDAKHEAPRVPAGKPSALEGARLSSGLDLSRFDSAEYYRSHAPYDLFEALREMTTWTEEESWDVAALLWSRQTTPERLGRGRELYAQNCAACHGETGRGDGIFAEATAQEATANSPASGHRMEPSPPSDFTQPAPMLGASPALLQGKILRGGMGTGMPMWGSIFTEEQIWDLVAYLYSFQFEYP